MNNCEGDSTGAPLALQAVGAAPDDPFTRIAELYRRERDTVSQNALILDPWFDELARVGTPLRVLDLGCGTGTTARLFAARGHRVVALDSSPAMLAQLRASMPESDAARMDLVQADAASYEPCGTFDLILLNLLIDHIEHTAPLLGRLTGALNTHGRMIVVVPHPFKDSGVWVQSDASSSEYVGLLLGNYFYEGPITKARYSDSGQIAIHEVRSFKRNIGSYFRMLYEAGLSIDGLEEPAPRPELARPGSANFAKSSRIPYFLIFICKRRTICSSR